MLSAVPARNIINQATVISASVVSDAKRGAIAMRRSNRARLGLCLPVLALCGLAGCAYDQRGDGRSGGYYGNGAYAYPPGGYYGGPYAGRYDGYRRGWWGRDRDDRDRYDRDDRKGRQRYADDDDWQERRYGRLKDNGRQGDAERFNDRLCRNGIPKDAPAGC